jgi:hypothetical protein
MNDDTQDNHAGGAPSTDAKVAWLGVQVAALSDQMGVMTELLRKLTATHPAGPPAVDDSPVRFNRQQTSEELVQTEPERGTGIGIGRGDVNPSLPQQLAFSKAPSEAPPAPRPHPAAAEPAATAAMAVVETSGGFDVRGLQKVWWDGNPSRAAWNEFIFDASQFAKEARKGGPVSDMARIENLAGCFKNDSRARSWFREMHKEIEAKQWTFNHFVQQVEENFVSKHSDEHALSAYDKCRQGSATVPEYILRFRTAVGDLPRERRPSEFDLVRKFSKGLADEGTFKYVYGNGPEGKPPASLRDATQLATSYYDLLLTFGQKTTLPPRQKQNGGKPSAKLNALPSASTASPAKSKRTTSALTPASPGHLAKLTQEQRQECMDNGLCFKCRQPGHSAAACPSRSAPSTPARSRAGSVSSPAPTGLQRLHLAMVQCGLNPEKISDDAIAGAMGRLAEYAVTDEDGVESDDEGKN